MKIGYLMQAGVPDVRKRPDSGPATHVRQIFEQLCRLGHRVRLVAVLDGRLWSSDDLQHYEPLVVKWLDRGPFRILERAVRRIQAELGLPYGALFESFRFAMACRRQLAGFDLLYERMGWVGYGGGLAAGWLGIPLILEVNGDHLLEMQMQGAAPKGAQLWLSKALMKKATRSAAHVVATGEGWRQRFIAAWNADPAKVTVIENGSELVGILRRDDLRSFSSDPDSTASPTVAYSGAFDPWQGVSILIRAAAKAVAEGTRLRLVLIGSGRGVKEAEKAVEECRMGRYVAFTGQLPPTRYGATLAQADIGVSPYCGRSEYSGLKLFDYKAAGLATIASGENGQPSAIEHGSTGLIVPPCDEHALCAAIVRLVSDVERRKQMGRQARIEAEQSHGWDKTAERLERLFHQVKASPVAGGKSTGPSAGS